MTAINNMAATRGVMSQPTDQWATRDDVRQVSQDVLSQINQRFDDLMDRGDQRHGENVRRMEYIADQTRQTNGRVTALEVIVRNIKEDFNGIRKRWHDFRDSFQQSTNTLSSDEKLLTRKELGWIIALIVGSIAIGATVTIWVLSVKAHTP